MLTDAYWIRPLDPLAPIEAGMRLASQQRADEIAQQDAAARLRLNYDSLAQQRAEAQNRLALSLASSKQAADANRAALALRLTHEDALSNYQQQRLAEEQQRISDAELKGASATEALRSKQSDTAKFLSEAPTIGAGPAFLKYPNADEATVRSVAEQQVKAGKTPPEKVGTIEFSVPGSQGGINATRIKTLLNDRRINSIMGTNAPPGTGTNYVENLSPLPSAATSGKTLDKDTALKFLKAAGGDKDKARKLARDAGYTF